MKITEQIEEIKKGISQLDYSTDKLAFSKYVFYYVHLRDILKPIHEINKEIDRLESINRVINSLSKPPVGRFSDEGHKEMLFSFRKKEAIELIDQLKDNILTINQEH